MIEIIEADLTWIDESFQRGIQIEVDTSGRIARLGRLGLSPRRRLVDQALLPGFVNAHSHAFQRGLRGRGEVFPEGEGTFWSWREAMYALVPSLDETRFYELTIQAFREMRRAGITAVGEFHYLHHSPDTHDYSLDPIVLAAASAAGIRIVLLSTYYRAGGIGQPLAPSQRRFETKSVEEFLQSLDRLSGLIDSREQSLGVVAHSVRAVPMADVARLHAESASRGLVFHMHVEEQQREIDDCVAAFGKTPMALVNGQLKVDSRFTAVHCTHTDPAEMKRFLAAGGNVCITPLTEANLGDGIAEVKWIRSNQGVVALGTDSNSRISMIEEMRWLEYGQRLQSQSRGVIRDSKGRVARVLLAAATKNGARSLGIEAGEIRQGLYADFTAIDLNAVSLAGWDEDTLLESLVFGAGDEVILATAVGGRWMKHRSCG